MFTGKGRRFLRRASPAILCPFMIFPFLTVMAGVVSFSMLINCDGHIMSLRVTAR